MSGPLPVSPFPKGRLSTVWEYLVTQLKADGVLSAAIDQWEVRTGDIEDRQPTVAGTDAITLKLETTAGALRWTDEQRHGGTWNIGLELYLPTTSESVALDAWEAVYNAIPWPHLSDHYDTMVNQGGCHEIVMIGPAFTRQDSAGCGGVRITGTIQLLINVSDRA